MNARGFVLAGLTTLCALVGGLVFSGASALAAGPPIIEGESVANVASSSATLQAIINPGGEETTYRFEYGTSTSYGTSSPVPDGKVGSGAAGVAVSVHTQALSPDTGYHFRVVAVSGVETVDGPDRVFTTQALGTAFALPDGRQYELVSPPEKDGAEVRGIEGYGGGGIVQASENGEKITYITLSPPEADPLSNPGVDQLFSERDSDGWSTRNISLHYLDEAGIGVGTGAEYRGFSSDLSRGIVVPLGGSAPLSPEAPLLGPQVPYLRDDLSVDYTPLMTKAEVGAEPGVFGNRYLDAAPDFSHVVFEAAGALTPNAISGVENLYEWVDGELKLISVLPSGETATEAFFWAVSSDGTHVIWTNNPAQGYTLYSSDVETGETVQVDLSQGGPDAGGPSAYQVASSDGSRIFFNSTAELTSDARTCKHCAFQGASEGGDLYEFDLSSHALVDLTVDSNGSDVTGADVLGVIGASEDGSYVYFVAEGALTVGATSGEPNLYVAHYDGASWTTRFIGTLAGGEGEGNNWRSGLRPQGSFAHFARVSGNGRFAAFSSLADLTGYDNADANTGQADAEVYVYDADSGKLTCASCSATGARPVAPASIPGFTPMSNGYGVYQSRYLSDQGRLFFDTGEALVPQDVNGKQDVYEYEPDGVGSCTLAAGCVALISSGGGLESSAFVDASASGDDVFFITEAQLVSQDTDHGFDMYDAHVCSSGAPCFGVPPAGVPACSNADQCKPPPTPQPALFGAPASATFVGSGNPASGAVKPPVVGGHAKAKKGSTGKKKRGRKRTTRGGSKRSGVRRDGARKSRARGSLSGRAGLKG